MGRSYGIIYGISYGIFIDIWIGRNIGITSICLAFIGFLGGVFDKNFSKDSRMTIMLMVFGSTFLVEALNYLLDYIFSERNLMGVLYASSQYQVLLILILIEC